MAKLSGWAQQIMQDIDLPDGMIDSTYHNDLCPSVMTKPTDGGWYVQLFIDYPDRADREDEQSDRYTVLALDDAYLGEKRRDYTTESYADALTAVLGLQYALTVREWLINDKADCTAHANQYSEMCALYFDQQTAQMENPAIKASNIAAEYCDDNMALLEAYTAVYGDVGDELQDAFPAMDKAYDFAVAHVFTPAGNGDSEFFGTAAEQED